MGLVANWHLTVIEKLISGPVVSILETPKERVSLHTCSSCCQETFDFDRIEAFTTLFYSSYFPSDLIDLWVIKIKKSMSFAHIARQDQENSMKHRLCRGNKQKVCLFYRQNNRIVLIMIKHGRHCLRSSHGVHRYVVFFFLILLFMC